MALMSNKAYTPGSKAAATREAAKPRTQQPQSTRPIPEGAVDNGRRYSVAEKAQALTLYQIGMKPIEIGRHSDTPSDSVRYWIRTAKQRGWEGAEAPGGTDRRRLLEGYVEAGRGSGRPKGECTGNEQAISEGVTEER